MWERVCIWFAGKMIRCAQWATDRQRQKIQKQNVQLRQELKQRELQAQIAAALARLEKEKDRPHAVN